jgi:hypothetical protein
MSEEQINEAIATHIFGYEDYDMLLPYSSAPKRKLYGATKFANNWTLVPDYCNDLNAMAEAENTLNDDQQYEYAYVLDDLIKNRSCEFDLIHASARMRAEAFVRTIGKWKE